MEVTIPESKEEYLAATAVEGSLTQVSKNISKKSNSSSLRELIVCGVVLLNYLLILKVFEYLALESGTPGLYTLASWLIIILSFGSVIFGLTSLFRDAGRALSRKVLEREVCEVLGILTLLAVLVVEFWQNPAEIVLFPITLSLIPVCFFLALNRWVSDQLREISGSYISLKDCKGGGFWEKSATGEAESELVHLQKGDWVPGDGEILSGAVEVEERKFSANPLVRRKGVGQEVFYGSQVLSGSADIRLFAGAVDSVFSYFSAQLRRVVKSVEWACQLSDTQKNLIYGSLIFLTACTGIAWYDRGATLYQITSVIAGIALFSSMTRFFDGMKNGTCVALSVLFRSGFLAGNFEVLNSLRKVKSLLIDCDPRQVQTVREITDFELIDDRIDKNTLGALLLAVFGGAESSLIRSLQNLFPGTAKLPIQEVESLQFVPGQGVTGIVEGNEVTIGTEDFLVNRGVYIQPSETVTENTDRCISQWYIAIGHEVIARFQVKFSFLNRIAKLVRNAEKHGITVIAGSESEEKEFEKSVRDNGIESIHFAPGLTQKRYQEKLQDLSPVALYCTGTRRDEFDPIVDVMIGQFDELQWDTKGFDLVSFDSDPLGFQRVLDLVKRRARVLQINKIFAISIGILLFLLTVTGFVSPLVVSVTMLLVTLFFGLNILSISAREKS